MTQERLLIAMDYGEQRARLFAYLAARSDRFQLSCTVDDRILQDAIGDDSFSAVIADRKMMASLSGNLTSRDVSHDEQKPLLPSPVLPRAKSADYESVAPSSAGIVDDLQLLGNRLNRAVDVWRRVTSDRRMVCRQIKSNVGGKGRDPATGLLLPSALQGLRRNENPSRDRRTILGCVTLRIKETYRADDTELVSVARHVQEKMHRGDLGVRWDNRTIVILRPSSPLGECWIWAEELLQQIGVAAFEQFGTNPVAGMSALQVNTASFCDATIDAGARAADYSATRQGGCVQTAMTELLFGSCHWDELRRLPETVRRTRLLQMVEAEMGPAQVEHLGAHCESVSQVARDIAIALGFNDDAIEHTRLAGLFHDIGKMLVPEDILSKPGPLSTAEKVLMAKHASWGEEICSRLGLDHVVCEAVRDHHARFDDAVGEVSQIARIICAADAMVAIAMKRDYACARSLKIACEELRRKRGSQFDPSVVDVACSMNVHL
jgi:putative nucleotidyltransferase with HDIG domain